MEEEVARGNSDVHEIISKYLKNKNILGLRNETQSS